MSTLSSVELGVLGSLQVRQDGAPVAIPGSKPRAILTMLGLHDGSVVPAATLVELLWGHDPPRTAAKALQTHISSLRRALGDGFVLTQGAGWILAESEVDASRYKSAARLGRDAAAAGDTSQAVARFDEALALWRGVPELPDGRRGTSEKTRWIEGHAALVEDRADALLATGRAAEVIGDLEAAVAEAPLRERRWGQLMLALYRAGRQGEALSAYQRARSLLADELGVDPGPNLRRLEAAIVAQESSLDIAVSQQVPSVTRAVTFLLTDIEGSTAAWEADADAMAVALARHDELVEQVVTSRGGRLIKTRGEGDATFSVFDRPSAAAAAALELQDAIAQEPWALHQPIRVRMALHTGEVELRDGDYFGRAVNRVARLRSLAEGGQILCSGATAELVIDSLADDVMLTDLGLRQLKNLARPEHVFELRLETGAEQLESQAPEAPMMRPGVPAVLVGPGPFVGRGNELDRLLSAWQAALAGGVRTMLIAGEPGVGKTRLAGEWSQRAYDLGAVVLYGRCDEDLGAPYQPFAEALRSLVPCMGADRLRGLRGVEALLSLVPGLADVMPDLARPAHPDPDTERYALFDAVVALLETASKSMPVLLVLDDLHWAAKPTLLLLRHLLRFGDHARIQIVGTYRSTDLDRSHPLAAMLADLHRDGTANRLSLSGLDEEDVTTYVTEAGYDDEDLAHALAAVTGGNPFFLIEALRHVDESGGVWDQSTLPQGVREAVSRRLSRLPAETNKALAAAAVVGSRFALELVERVVEDDLIDAFDEACQAGIVIEESGGYYRFNHAIVRQSLLAELASVRRMRLHQRIATTLEALPGADDELLAELAHHYFECAWAGNAAKAVIYCRRAADQAMTRLAYEGAADLYHHALNALEELDDELPDRDDQTAELLVARCEALLAAGDVASAAGAVSQLQSATIDSARLAAWATCFDGQLSMLIHPERLDEAEAALGAAAAKLAELDDAAGEAKAHTVRAGCLNRLGRIADCEVALDDALTAARRAREHRRVNAVLAGAPLAALWGPNPVPRAGGRCLDVVRLLRITTDSPAVEATSTRCQAVLEAFRGRAAAARRMIDSARRTVTELGLRHALLEVEQFAGIVELIVDDPVAAEAHLRKAYNGFRRMGLDADTAETAALLGRTCLALDRDGEADELCTESERLAGHALKASIEWRTLRAHLLARGNDYDAARRVAEEAVRLAERTDALVDHADACLTLATVLSAAGDTAGARTAAERAVDLYERKGAAALAEMARAVLGKRVEPTLPTPPEMPAVALVNACSQAGERVLAAINREDWEEFERLFAPEAVGESRRKMVGFSQTDIPSGQWPRLNRRVAETGDVRGSQVVIAVRGERLALARVKLGTSDVSAGAPYDEFLQVYGIDENERIALQISFDLDDIDAAIAELDAVQARLDAERPPARRLQNLATRVYHRFWTCFADRNWDAAAAIVSEGLSGADHRRVVNAGDRGSRETVIEDLKVAADLGFAIWMVDVVAIRGERLALTRVRAADPDPDTIQNDAFNLIEIDADEGLTSIVVFDLDDIETAIAEVDARYLAGEALPYAGTWSVITGTFASISRQELPAMAPDCATIDHRHVATFAPGELPAYIRAGWDVGQNLSTYVNCVHRLDALGAVVSYAAYGKSREGFDGEWHEIAMVTVEEGVVNRCELFNEGDLQTAIARFDQQSRPAPRLENAASQTYERMNSYFAARDWAAIAELLADEVCTEDRRRVVNSGLQHGRDAVCAEISGFAEVGAREVISEIVATRGDHLVLSRAQSWGRDHRPEAFHAEALQIIEVDAAERIVAILAFDLDDFDAAVAELDGRYLTGEAAAHARAWSAVAGSYAALNRHEPPLTTPDCVNVDHRRETAFGPGDVNAYIQAGWDSEQDIEIYVERVHRLSDVAVVATYAAHEKSEEGLRAEWRGVALFGVEDDRINRTEVFDEKDIDAAIAKFERLTQPAPQLENAASHVNKRFQELFAARDWAALAEGLADNVAHDDRRRVVGMGLRHGKDAMIAEARALVAIGVMNATSDVIAIRGQRLVFGRIRTWGRDQRPEAFHTDSFEIVEIDSDERIVARVVFDVDDIDGAIAELEARYLAGEAAPHTHTWSVITRAYDALNRREHPLTTPDWSNIDHRRGISFAPGDGSTLLANWNATPDLNNSIEAVHRLNDFGAVVTSVTHETSREGFHAEWRVINVLTVAGDLIDRLEVFDETDIDAAVARFEELHQPTPRLENTASRVVERFVGHFAPRDWEALMAMMAEHYLVDDRRRAVNAGIRHGRDAAAEDFRAAAAVGFTDATSTVIATRGTRLTLCRLRFTNRDQRPESFRIETLLVAEIDVNETLAEAVVFEPDDLNAAMAELDARYLAGEAAAHADTWSVVAGVHATFNRHEYPPEDWVTIDHRRGTPFTAGTMTSAVHTLFDLTPDFKVYIETVHHLDSVGAVITNVAHGSTPDGLGVEWRMVMLLIVDGGRLTRCEVFDETDSDVAIARLEDLRRRMWRLENAASRVTERFWSCYAIRDWNAMAQSLADEISSHDRRRVVNAGVRRGRDHQLADMRALAEIEANITVSPIAIRGERLVLDRIRSSNHNLQHGEFGVELLVLAEIDTDERISAHVVFDVDDIDAALGELDSRYLSGEAAAHAHTWSVISGAYAAMNRHQLFATTPDFIDIDHRHVTTMASGDAIANLRASWELAPNLSIYIEAVHRLNHLGTVITYAAIGTSQNGFEGEWRAINILTIQGDLISRAEIFDEKDLAAALARFEELGSPPPALKNAASQAYERICQYLETRDWSALTELCAENVSVDDRRRVVNGGLTTDRDTAIRDLQVAAEIGFSYKLLSVMATRGNRLVLVRVRAAGRDPEAIASDALNILEVESDGRITADVIFDLDDIDAAFEELENRYLAGEAAIYRHTWSTLLRGFNAFNEHKLPSTTPDWVTIDHRRGRAFSPGDLVPYIYATWQVAPQAKIYVDAVHRLNNLGAVVTQSTHGTSSDGFDAEWREVNLMTLDGDLINRCEVFDEEDLETAIVAFDQLCRPAAQLENLASRVTERFLASFAACDWDAVAETLAEDFSQNDRRRVVGAGIRHGRAAEIADLQAIANLGMVNVSSTLIATRGERLVLMRVGFSFRDKGPEAFFGEMLGISEINADEGIVAAVSFDRDDIDAAFAELDARYLAGEAAAYAHTWSVVAEANAQFNRHELPATTPDPVYIDHRPLVSIEGVDLATSVGAMWDLASDASAYIEAVHQLNEPGTVVTQVLKMTTQEGFDAELRLTYMIVVEDNLLSRIEVFDESDLDAALARFEELRPHAPRLDNAASQVVERLLAHFGSCQFDLIAEILADDSFVDDRRRIINAGRWQGREIVIENMRALAGEATTTSTVLAIRGERLAIARIYFANRNLQQADFGFEMLSVVELDAENRISAIIVFDPNDLDAAFRELEMRYLAGEAAAHMNTWSVISQSYAGFNRGEPPATTPDWVMIDRRPLVTSETVDLAASIHGIWDVIPSIYINIEAVHRLSELGAVVTQTIRGTSQEGFDAEWRMIDIYKVDHGLLSRSELFDEADLDAALTRFDELHAQSCQLENAASQADDRFFTCFRARDWEAMAEILAVGSFVDDRRRVVNIGVWHGRDVVITNIRALAEVAPTITSAVTATRGDRVALTHICAPDRDLRHGEFGVEMLGVVEIGTDGRITAHVLFDPDDIDGAFAELDARYLAGEAAAHADTWSVVAGVPARFNRHELPATTPDPVYIDHRPVVSIEDADLAASIRAVWDITSDASVYIEAGHQLSEHGAVFTEVLKMTSQEGFDAEVRMIMMFTVEGGLISRVEVFDEADLDTALTRFDDLHSPPEQLENAASRMGERFLAHFKARNWDGMAEILADHFSQDDRRRMIGAGVRHGRDAQIADMRAIADLRTKYLTSTVMATRGERLALVRMRLAFNDEVQEGFLTDVFVIVEINSDNRFVAAISFDFDDIDAAVEELDARYLAGEAAAYSQTWSVIAQTLAAFNRQDLLAGDWVTVDHRPLTLDEIDSTTTFRSAWDLTPNLHIHIEAVHQLSNFGAIVTYAAYGTSPEGFDAEWRMIMLLTVAGDRINRCEIFDEADLDAALARFDELTGKDQSK